MRVAFFHGLESSHKSDKNSALAAEFDFVYDPPMDYKDSHLFERTLKAVKENNIDLLIGSSMGGYFAYCISTLTGIPTLLFNPTFVNRSMEPVTHSGNIKSNHTVVLGSKDDVIDPVQSRIWMTRKGVGRFDINWESNGHRTPIDIFTKWIKIESHSMNEEWDTDTPVGTDWSFLPEEVVQELVPNFLSKRPPVGNLTVEDDEEIEEVKAAQSILSKEEIAFAKHANDSPPSVFYNWLTVRGEKPLMKDLTALWKDEENIHLINRLKEHTARPRPYIKSESVFAINGTETDTDSFPSGHSCGAYFMAEMLTKKYPHLQEGLHALANRIAKSRVQAGVHYPSDVEAGKRIGITLAKIRK